MSGTQALALIEALDTLYESVVRDPRAWDAQALAEWADETVANCEPRLDRTAVRELRRGVRQARRLQGYWARQRAQGAATPADWKSAVDQGLGSGGWKPSLELARQGLETAPSPQLFEEVRRRFRVVHFQPWMEGITYEEWLKAKE
ncbi:MAG: hypothetical protein ACE5KX_00275 [Acidimicrobiia bacterium]